MEALKGSWEVDVRVPGHNSICPHSEDTAYLTLELALETEVEAVCLLTGLY